MTSQQLIFNFKLNVSSTFTNFKGSDNQELCALLQKIASGAQTSNVYIYGATGVGRTHLLQACCHTANQHNLDSVYLPLTQKKSLHVQMLEGLENLALVCIDDIEQICGDSEWEEALFHLYNRMQITGNSLIISGLTTPQHVDLKLNDLRSRLMACVAMRVHALSDADKLAILQQRAHLAGLALTDDVGNFLLTRCTRSLPELIEILQRLDEASLAAQRRLTIPFIKKVLQL